MMALSIPAYFDIIILMVRGLMTLYHPYAHYMHAALGMWVLLTITHDYSSSSSAYVYFVVACGYLVHASLYHSSSHLGVFGTWSSGKGRVQGFSGFRRSVFIIKFSLYTPRFPRAIFGHPHLSHLLLGARPGPLFFAASSSLLFGVGWWLCTFIKGMA